MNLQSMLNTYFDPKPLPGVEGPILQSLQFSSHYQSLLSSKATTPYGTEDR